MFIEAMFRVSPSSSYDGHTPRSRAERDDAELMDSFNGITHRPASVRLIVMSNRAPIRFIREGGKERVEPTVGGVGTTFLRLLERSGGLW
jgi:hypothetical protein